MTLRTNPLGKVTACCRFLAAFVLLALPFAAAGGELSGLRNSAAYIRVTGETSTVLIISFAAVWSAYEDCFEHFYVQAPDGSLIAKKRIDAGVDKGVEKILLDRGPGDYRVSFSGETYHVFSISSDPPSPIVFQCPPVHMALSSPVPERLYFHVPEGTSDYTFSIKNHDLRPLDVTLIPPDGPAPIAIRATEAYKNLRSKATIRQERDYFHYWEYDSSTIRNPKPGFWGVEFDRQPRVSIWLEGVPDFFASSPASWFAPSLLPGNARITGQAGRVNGPVGTLGTSFPGPHVSDLMDERVKFLGIQSFCRYINHDLREPQNDDDDPKNIRWRNFDWGDDDTRFDWTARWGAETLLITNPASWLGGGEGLLHGNDSGIEEYAEFVEALLTHYNVRRGTPIQYLSLIDEPNDEFTAEQYERLIRIVGQRLKTHPDKRIQATHLMVPQSSGFLKYPLGAERSGSFMAESIYRTSDDLVGGIAWDQWAFRNMFDTWLYGEAIERAAEIQVRWNTDGEDREPIVIFQTNFFGGGNISFQDTRTFYAALWWASVVTQTMKTGRMTSLNWFTMFDDPHHMKGLCESVDSGGKIKPVGYAMKMLAETLLDNAAISSSDHPEVDEILTVSEDKRHVNLLLVNKLSRRINLRADIELPVELQDQSCRMQVLRMKDGDKSMQVLAHQSLAPARTIHLNLELEGESIYAFDIGLAE